MEMLPAMLNENTAVEVLFVEISSLVQSRNILKVIKQCLIFFTDVSHTAGFALFVRCSVYIMGYKRYSMSVVYVTVFFFTNILICA